MLGLVIVEDCGEVNAVLFSVPRPPKLFLPCLTITMVRGAFPGRAKAPENPPSPTATREHCRQLLFLLREWCWYSRPKASMARASFPGVSSAFLKTALAIRAWCGFWHFWISWSHPGPAYGYPCTMLWSLFNLRFFFLIFWLVFVQMSSQHSFLMLWFLSNQKCRYWITSVSGFCVSLQYSVCWFHSIWKSTYEHFIDIL